MPRYLSLTSLVCLNGGKSELNFCKELVPHAYRPFFEVILVALFAKNGRSPPDFRTS